MRTTSDLTLEYLELISYLGIAKVIVVLIFVIALPFSGTCRSRHPLPWSLTRVARYFVSFYQGIRYILYIRKKGKTSLID